uniref:C-C chemokine receptor type 10-like n=1 Tax=Podarcis muralis TaxID=64176 RepID=UPI00109F74B6|nr:C-C chemokine receptor type 10-like [Podarcis muralis]XP_028559642.1 C-C chemokine receptor type 10-like [Podarcis muralis]
MPDRGGTRRPSPALLRHLLGSALLRAGVAALALPYFMYSCVEDYGGVHLYRMADITAVVSLVQVALGFVLPFTVIAACYTAITCALLASLCAQSLKALRLILALVLVFLALQLPYALLTSLDMTALMGHQALSCKVILRRDLALLITSALAFFSHFSAKHPGGHTASGRSAPSEVHLAACKGRCDGPG